VNDKKLEQAHAKIAKLNAAANAANDVFAAAWVLVSGWESTGFYDRQEPAGALALHEALAAYEASG
jgi:hypothetical protein